MVNDYIIFCSIKLWQIFQLFAFGDYSICLLVQLTVYYINILFSQDTYHFQLYGQSCWYHTRFRPGWKEFLEDMKKYYELHIFTMGSRMYAHTIARMLDPTGELFADRIRSRDESFDMFSKYRDLRFVIVWREEMREGGSEGGRKWGREGGSEGGRKEGNEGGRKWGREEVREGGSKKWGRKGGRREFGWTVGWLVGWMLIDWMHG